MHCHATISVVSFPRKTASSYRTNKSLRPFRVLGVHIEMLTQVSALGNHKSDTGLYKGDLWISGANVHGVLLRYMDLNPEVTLRMLFRQRCKMSE
jgi:hypothetical protein